LSVDTEGNADVTVLVVEVVFVEVVFESDEGERTAEVVLSRVDDKADVDDVLEDLVLNELPDEADWSSLGVRKPSLLRSSSRNWPRADFFHFFHSYIPIWPSPSVSPSA
jgi:hypothetical protein